MSIDIIQYLDEAIILELKVSELYHLFSNVFVEDREFWWQLEIEEKNHAALLKSGKEFYKHGKFPLEIFPERLEILKETISQVNSLIETFNSGWTRKKAFDTSIVLENSAGEIHFQNFMRSDAQSEIAIIFQKLNRHDCDHSLRITRYISDHGIK